MSDKKSAPEVDPNNPENFPLFQSTTGKTEMLALLSGHSAHVNVEPTPLHPRFHRVAVAKGCFPAAMAASHAQVPQQAHEMDRQALILKAIGDMVAIAAEDPSKQPELFTNDGRPDARALAVRLGFTVNSTERDRAWNEYSKDGDED